jgi:hypothetical protein
VSERQYKQHQARERFTFNLQKLEVYLRMGEKRAHLDTAVELLETLLELTGPVTIETAAMRVNLCSIKKRIALRGLEERARLRLVRNTESN